MHNLNCKSIFNSLLKSVSALFVILFFSTSTAQVNNQLAQAVSIEGRIYHNNAPVNEIVDIMFEVYVEGFPTCTLYRDVHENVNVSDPEDAAQGYFSEQLGAGGTIQMWTSSSLTQVFANNVTLSGESGCTVTDTQLLGRKRLVRVSVKKDSEMTYSILDEGVSVASVPTAMVAETLQGYYSKDFFINTGGTTHQAQLYNLLGLNFTDLSNVVAGTSSKYLQTNTGGAVMPSYSADPTSTAGQMWFNSTDNAIKFKDASGVTKTVGVAGSGIETITGSNGVTAVTTGSSTALSAAVDNTTVEINSGNIRIKDSGVSNNKISDVSVSKITSGMSQYFSYMPNGAECATGQVLKWNMATDHWECGNDTVGVLSHNGLSDLTVGDDHTQYAHLTGRSGGQILVGGNAASENLTLSSTSHATKGNLVLQPSSGNVGIHTTTPMYPLDVGFSVSSNNIGVNVLGGVRASNLDSGIVRPIRMMNSFNVLGAGTAISFEGVNSSGVLRTYGLISASSSDHTAGSEKGRMDFQTAVGSSLSTVMTLTSEGRVGIGQSNPNSYKLDILGSSNDQQSGSMRIRNLTPGTATGSFYYSETADSGGFVGAFPSTHSTTPIYADKMVLSSLTTASGIALVSNSTTGDIRFYAGGSSVINERMRITHDGKVGFDTTAPVVSFDLGTKTDALRLPAGTTSERPTGTAGMIRYNTTSSVFEGHNGTSWASIANPGNIDHDQLLNFVANEHIDHSAVSISTAVGSGLSGGGNITATRSLAVDIPGLTNLGPAAAATDYLMIYDTSASGLRKISVTDFASWALTDVSSITSMLGTSQFTYTPIGVACITGQVLKWNGTYWACGTDASGGSSTFADGAIAAPSIAFTNDPDVGLWRPSSNEIGIVSGGSEKVRFASDGSVGIGSLAPRAKLDVAGEIKIGTTVSSCNADRNGAVRVGAGGLEYCDSTAWRSIMPARGRRGKIYKTAGSYNWTVPDFVTSIKVTLIGGGGGYNTGCSNGGGQSGSIYGYINVNPGDTITINVGAAGGIAGSSYSNAPAGQDSSLSYSGQTLIAGGGPGELGSCAFAGYGTSSASGVTEFTSFFTRDLYIGYGGGGNNTVGQSGFAEIEW